MNKRHANKIITVFIASVWFINGFFCKVLNLVPRHKEIVEKILYLESSEANIFTIVIGFAEIIMAIWIVSRIQSKLNAIVQIVIITIMNVLEFFFVPYLLLWGKFNSLFAFLFICIIFYNEFILTTFIKRNP